MHYVVNNVSSGRRRTRHVRATPRVVTVAATTTTTQPAGNLNAAQEAPPRATPRVVTVAATTTTAQPAGNMFTAAQQAPPPHPSSCPSTKSHLMLCCKNFHPHPTMYILHLHHRHHCNRRLPSISEIQLLILHLTLHRVQNQPPHVHPSQNYPLNLSGLHNHLLKPLPFPHHPPVGHVFLILKPTASPTPQPQSP
jgi:hypothetical protein